jgi:hypothetical protein
MAAPVETCRFPVFKTNMLHVSDMAELLWGPLCLDPPAVPEHGLDFQS